MKNIINILKHGFKKNRIMGGVVFFIYLLLLAVATSLVGNGIVLFLNFFFVMIALIIIPIVSFFKFTRRLSKENALLFSTPIKSHEYIIAKVIEYALVAVPIVIIFFSQVLLVNIAYEDFLSLVYFVEFVLVAVGVMYILGVATYMEMICIFIGVKRYTRGYGLSILVTIGAIIGIEIVSEIVNGVIHKILPHYYYVEIIGIRVGIVDIIIGLIVTIGLYIIGKKSLEKGIDFN
ncbi:MAG: hypothetical protein ACRC28_14510 [Clostridium sp.]|uniref:hypothetical protein n=1 Tax=Clostridium sp. TaxID=1506 RepID=UPI003F30E7A0